MYQKAWQGREVSGPKVFSEGLIEEAWFKLPFSKMFKCKKNGDCFKWKELHEAGMTTIFVTQLQNKNNRNPVLLGFKCHDYNFFIPMSTKFQFFSYRQYISLDTSQYLIIQNIYIQTELRSLSGTPGKSWAAATLQRKTPNARPWQAPSLFYPEWKANLIFRNLQCTIQTGEELLLI